MKTNCLLRIFVFLFLMAITTSCYPARYDGPYKGKIIDAETGAPIEGVVILGVWYKETPTVAGAVSSFYDASETVSDKNGDFEIKGLGLKIFSNVTPMNVVIFKAGYEHISTSWDLFKENDSYKKKIKWDGEKALIHLRKWTIEERRNRFGDYYLGGVPDEKQRLLLQEIEKEYKDKYRVIGK